MRQKRNEEQNVLGIYLAIAGVAWLCVGVRVYGCVWVRACVHFRWVFYLHAVCHIRWQRFLAFSLSAKYFPAKQKKSHQWQRRRRQRRLWQLKIIFAARAFWPRHTCARHTRHMRCAASTLAKQRPGSVRSKPQLCNAGRPGAECKGEWVAAQASLRLWQLRQRAVKHTRASIAVNVVADADATSVE